MREKLKGLDAVRAFACTAIFTFHCFLSLLGPFAVSVFFVLSGFLLVYNYYDREGFECREIKDCARFSFRRIAKLYPLHVLTLCVMLAFTASVVRPAGAELRETLCSFAASLLLVQSWVPDSGFVTNLNGVAWYLSDMLFLYMLFPLLLRRIKKYGGKRDAYVAIAVTAGLMLAAALAFAGVYNSIMGAGAVLVNELDVYFSYYMPVYRLGDFFVGCNLAYIFLTREKKETGAMKATALETLAIAASALAYWIYCRDFFPRIINRSLLFLLPSALLIYAFALGRGKISALLDCRAVHFIAGLSTEIFLIHQVVIKLGTFVINLLPIPLWLMKWGGFTGIAVMTLLLSWLYSRYSGKGRAKRKGTV